MEGRRLRDTIGARECCSGDNLLGRRDEENVGLFVYLIDAWAERSMLGGRRKLDVKGTWQTVRELKGSIARLLKIPANQQRLYYRSAQLQDHRTLEESGIHKSGATLLFDARPRGGHDAEASVSEPSLEPISCAALHRRSDGALPPALGRAFLKARRALIVNAKAPSLAMDGTGGTYFMHDIDGRAVGCFKPADEEPFCVNNPRHFVGPHCAFSARGRDVPRGELSSMRLGVRPGEAHAREVAAYLLDCAAGHVAGVPETTLAESRHAKYCYADRVVREKVGSFQVFVPHEGIAEDYGPNELDVARLQAVAALDMRALNCDRNSANLLVRWKNNSTSTRLDVVPIDHGFILPDVLEIEWFDWCWIDWPAVRAPLCEQVKKHILALDAAADADMLRDALGLRPPCLRLMRAATGLLQRGVAAGLTLRDVASLMVPSRRDASSKARLHTAVQHASELAHLTLAEERRGPRRITPSVSPRVDGRYNDATRPRNDAKVAFASASCEAKPLPRANVSGLTISIQKDVVNGDNAGGVGGLLKRPDSRSGLGGLLEADEHAADKAADLGGLQDDGNECKEGDFKVLPEAGLRISLRRNGAHGRNENDDARGRKDAGSEAHGQSLPHGRSDARAVNGGPNGGPKYDNFGSPPLYGYQKPALCSYSPSPPPSAAASPRSGAHRRRGASLLTAGFSYDESNSSYRARWESAAAAASFDADSPSSLASHGGSPRWVDGLPRSIRARSDSEDSFASASLLSSEDSFSPSSSSEAVDAYVATRRAPREAAHRLSHRSARADDEGTIFETDALDLPPMPLIETAPPPPPLPPPLPRCSPDLDDDRRLHLDVVKRAVAPKTARSGFSLGRSLEGASLVRLHSCPALAQAAPPPLDTASGAFGPCDGGSPDRNRNVGRGLFDKAGSPHGSPRPFDEAGFDKHFFRFLDGLLEDLVRWKQLAIAEKRKRDAAAVEQPQRGRRGVQFATAPASQFSASLPATAIRAIALR
ncbi:phosphatidylinositol 3 and 4-kinase-domain-containing protein [Pelagophyceae sp. CCMP2097]|nr:phosphatidylinositol 3 and 4-kinase-domain-containing protein [Pelagophyceae sp. CCMP2097]|mmetsp:Transcript_1536/g.5638  ORF Transcript_1536/g.5638 Transcript_1536/m.5638 type:complete len:992 (-) Transcript_1536:329-3304(-)